MNDHYPSVGILNESKNGRRIRYRVLTSWFQGVAFRDYELEIGFRNVGIRPLSKKRRACTGRLISTPMLSKNGRELAARDEAAGTTKLFRLNSDASCTEILDLGRQTSKVGFSADGTLIAYSAPDFTLDSQEIHSTTYVLNRTTMRTSVIPLSRSSGLVIPEIVGTDSVLVAVTADGFSHEVEFRLFCCLR
jgi:hypothetical protein